MRLRTHRCVYMYEIEHSNYHTVGIEVTSMKLDSIDTEIISMLQEDGRRSFSDIAETVGRTEVTIRRRVKRLKDEGYIKRFTVVLDPLKIGKSIRAVIRVKTVMKHATAISKKLRKFNEINEAYFLDGACGLIMMVTVNDLTELYQFLEKRLGTIEGIGDAETCIVLEEVKTHFSDIGA